jgi:hypothetical protein
LNEEEKKEIDSLISSEIWLPLPGPQYDAYESEADEIFYGGAAGGGKTDLLLGLCLTNHQRSIIFRRESPQLQGIYDRLLNEILRTRDGFNGQDKIWRGDGKQIEFGSCPHVGDEQRYQGRAHDLKGFDEITHFQKSQYQFLAGWLRTTDKSQRCRVVCTGNPPTDSDGQWVLQHWGAWLDQNHPNPAEFGELRWYAMEGGAEVERPDGKPYKYGGELIQPKSRTFIPSSVEDNPFRMETGYKAQLQSLPEPLRSQMLKGDFGAGVSDDPWQVIPTEWVRLAQERWEKEQPRGLSMDSVGVDPARGGRDNTEISCRFGHWFSEMHSYPGADTPNGPLVASLAVSKAKDKAPIHVDVIGIGASVVDHLEENGVHTVAVNNSEKSEEKDKTGNLSFYNIRAQDWWRMREALDPDGDERVALPPCPEIKADLTTPRWKLQARGILVEPKEDIKKRIGRSPDKGDAIVLANRKTKKRQKGQENSRQRPSSGGWQGM